jgi:hypothetical protein
MLQCCICLVLLLGKTMYALHLPCCAGPSFRLVTELSVCIDAEEGEEILFEMSQLALLESLLVDSTDEFRCAAAAAAVVVPFGQQG